MAGGCQAGRSPTPSHWGDLSMLALCTTGLLAMMELDKEGPHVIVPRPRDAGPNPSQLLCLWERCVLAWEGAESQPDPQPSTLLVTFLPEEVLRWRSAAGAHTNHIPPGWGATPRMYPVLSPSLPTWQVTNVITPVLSYSYMAVLVPIFLLTDYLCYKPVLVLQSLSHISIWLLLVLGTSVLAMQLMEFFYGITMAARIAYSSYIFSLVAPSRYQRMASYSRSSVLMGVFTSSVLGQLCVTLGGVSFLTLNYVSLGFVSFGLILTLFLERPRRSLFFNRPGGAGDGAASTELDRMAEGDGRGRARGWRDAVLCRMLREVGALARQPQLRLWSLWWIFNSAGYYLMLYYAHILWNEISPTTDNRRVYNGGVDAASTLLGAVASFAAGYVKIRWTLWSELVIGVVTAFQAGLLLLMNSTTNIWLCYVAYVLFRGSYQFLVPIAIFQIATSLSKELCALVFGVNTFFGTVLKTIITVIVADERGLGLSVHPQFYMYFGYFTLLAVVYLLAAVGVGIQHSRRRQPAELALAKEPCQRPVEIPAQEKSPEAGTV